MSEDKERTINNLMNGVHDGKEVEDDDEKVEMIVKPVIENKTEKYLIYGINDSPPIHVTIISALQVIIICVIFIGVIIKGVIIICVIITCVIISLDSFICCSIVKQVLTTYLYHSRVRLLEPTGTGVI